MYSWKNAGTVFISSAILDLMFCLFVLALSSSVFALGLQIVPSLKMSEGHDYPKFCSIIAKISSFIMTLTAFQKLTIVKLLDL